MASLETYVGLYFDLDNPKADDVRLEDLCVALANTCRFGGHVTRYYSVAEHACLVYRLVKDLGASPDLCLAALHHDSHEAYVGDIPTPVKRKLGPEYKTLCRDIDEAIATAFSIDAFLFDHDLVEEADALALRIEAQEFKRSGGVGSHWGHDTPFVVPALVLFGLSPAAARGYFERCHVEAALLAAAP